MTETHNDSIWHFQDHELLKLSVDAAIKYERSSEHNDEALCN